MQPNLTTRAVMFSPASRLRVLWTESEWLQPLVIGLLIWAVVLAPIVYVLIEVW
jgi:hypothetical protein